MAGQHPNHIPTRKEKRGDRRCAKEGNTYAPDRRLFTGNMIRAQKKRKQLGFFFFFLRSSLLKKKKKRGRHQPDAKQIGDAALLTDRESQENGHTNWRIEVDRRGGI